MMKHSRRNIPTDIWRNDAWFIGLDTEERLMWLYLLTGPHDTGTYFRLALRTAAFETGLDPERIGDILTKFISDDHLEQRGDQFRLITDARECAHCGIRHDLTLDHIEPRSWGGANSPDNYQILCRKCNSTKGNRHNTRY